MSWINKCKRDEEECETLCKIMNPLGLQLGSHLPHPLNRAMWIPPSHPSHETVAYFKKSHATAAAHAGISLRAVEAQQRLFTLAFLWGLEGETDKEVGVHPQVLFLSTGVHFAIADMGLDEATALQEYANLLRNHPQDNLIHSLETSAHLSPYPLAPARALLLVWLLNLPTHCDAFLYLPRSASCLVACATLRIDADKLALAGRVVVVHPAREDACAGLRVCFWCGACPLAVGVTLRRCTGCHCVAYCSKPCQTQDWDAEHHRECGRVLVGRHIQTMPYELPSLPARELGITRASTEAGKEICGKMAVVKGNQEDAIASVVGLVCFSRREGVAVRVPMGWMVVP